MASLVAVRARKLEQLDVLLRKPGMYTPGGLSVEALVLHILDELAFIDGTQHALAGEIERLKTLGLWYPYNHAYGVTAAFNAILPDCVDSLDVEVTAVYAEVAQRLGYFECRVGVPSRAAWNEAHASWSRGGLSPRRARELLGNPGVELGSRSHGLALCYGASSGYWVALHFRTPVCPKGEAERAAWLCGVADGSLLLLRWIRISHANLDDSLTVTPAGFALTRRGRSSPQFLIERWLAGDPDPYDRAPCPMGEG